MTQSSEKRQEPSYQRHDDIFLYPSNKSPKKNPISSTNVWDKKSSNMNNSINSGISRETMSNNDISQKYSKKYEIPSNLMTDISSFIENNNLDDISFMPIRFRNIVNENKTKIIKMYQQTHTNVDRQIYYYMPIVECSDALFCGGENKIREVKILDLILNGTSQINYNIECNSNSSCEHILLIYEGSTIIINNQEYPTGSFKLNGLTITKDNLPAMLLITGNFIFVDGELYPQLDGTYQLRYTNISEDKLDDAFIEQYDTLIYNCQSNKDNVFIPEDNLSIISLLVKYNNMSFPISSCQRQPDPTLTFKSANGGFERRASNRESCVYYANFNNNSLSTDLNLNVHFRGENICQGEYRIYSSYQQQDNHIGRCKNNTIFSKGKELYSQSIDDGHDMLSSLITSISFTVNIENFMDTFSFLFHNNVESNNFSYVTKTGFINLDLPSNRQLEDLNVKSVRRRQLDIKKIVNKLLYDDIIMISTFKIRVANDILVYEPQPENNRPNEHISSNNDNIYQEHYYQVDINNPIVSDLQLSGEYKLTYVKRLDTQSCSDNYNDENCQPSKASFLVRGNKLILKSINGEFTYKGSNVQYLKIFSVNDFIPFNDKINIIEGDNMISSSIYLEKQELDELPGLDLRPMYGQSELIMVIPSKDAQRFSGIDENNILLTRSINKQFSRQEKLQTLSDNEPYSIIKITYDSNGRMRDLAYYVGDFLVIEDLTKRWRNPSQDNDLNTGYFLVSIPKFPQPVNTNMRYESSLITSQDLTVGSGSEVMF